MPPITNIAGVVCILFLMFFFPCIDGLRRLLCLIITATCSTPRTTKGGR